MSHAAPFVAQSTAWTDGTRNPAPVVPFDVIDTDSILVATVYYDTDSPNISNVRFGDGGGIGAGDVAPQITHINGRIRSYVFINPSVAGGLAFRYHITVNPQSQVPGSGVILYEISGANTSPASITAVTGSTTITTTGDHQLVVSFAGRNSKSDSARENSPLFIGEDHAILGWQIAGFGTLASASAVVPTASSQDISWLNASSGTIAYAFEEGVPYAPVVYEPFNYPAGALNAAAGNGSVGFSTPWQASVNSTVADGSLEFSPVPTAGGKMSANIGGNQFGGTRVIDASALAERGLLADGTTLWMSGTVGYGTGGNLASTILTLALANSQFGNGSASFTIGNDGSQMGSGVGISLRTFSAISGRIYATQFRDSSFGTGVAGNVLGTWDQAFATTFGDNQHGFFVCKITWGATQDVIEVYQPTSDMILTLPVSVLAMDVDQTQFDTLTFSRGSPVTLDEIRFGATYESVTGASTRYPTNTERLVPVLQSLEAHIRGTTPMSDEEITAARLLIDKLKRNFGDNAAVIQAAMNVVSAYDTVVGPLFLVGKDEWSKYYTPTPIEQAVFSTMQHIMDYVYTSENLVQHKSLLDGFKFGSSAKFPGAVAPPPPGASHTATVSASFVNSFGRDTVGWDLPARKPTGCYLAPGTFATVTVPASLVGKGYKIRVGAHAEDLSVASTTLRLHRITRAYDIMSTTFDVANPMGGGIYLEVPKEQDEGIVSITVQGAVRSPYFSRKPFHMTTNAEWLGSERDQPGPWADFQTEKFMMQVPSHWIRNANPLDDPEKLMADWDKAIDAMNEVMGFPLVRGKESMYMQVDVRAKTGGFGTGYPSTNRRDKNAGIPTSPILSYNRFIVQGPQFSTNAEFHEQGHNYRDVYFRMSMDGESVINLHPMIMQNKAFGMPMEQAFRYSLNFEKYVDRSLDSTATYWMSSFSFSPLKTTMVQTEAQYQAQGHAKYADLARHFGWQGLTNYFYQINALNHAGQPTPPGNDAKVLLLCKSHHIDVRPLMNFWGVNPDNHAALSAEIAANQLRQSPEIYDTLVRYKSLVPADNAGFRAWAHRWYSTDLNSPKKPSVTASDRTEREQARQWDDQNLFVSDANPSTTYMPRPANNEMYTEDSAADITARVQEIIDLYFPNGRPSDTPPAWVNDTIGGIEAAFGHGYQGSLAGFVNYGGGNVPLTFSKTSGPAWLSVAADGTLTGTPGPGDAGINTFTVLVDDGYGASIPATVRIHVIDPATLPVKIYLLAGQSNMVGQGDIAPVGTKGTLQYIVANDPSSNYQFLVDGSGNWILRDDVRFVNQSKLNGRLAPGFGANTSRIGPELGFGHKMGDQHIGPVLLVKAAWGGKSLGTDFRPPSSGGTTGAFYNEMLKVIDDAVANLGTYLPGYNGQGYEFAGFCWHQGWNDQYNPTHVAEYENNLTNLIHDVRAYVGVPELPVVVATSGMLGGATYHPIEAAQLAIADATKHPEFAGNVRVVDTRNATYLGQAYRQAVADSPANEGYHWNRNAMTYLHIGMAMGDEMKSLPVPRVPSRLIAAKDGAGIRISWQNGSEKPNSARVLRDGIEIAAAAPATPATYLDTTATSGIFTYEVQFDMPMAPCAPLTVTIDSRLSAPEAYRVTGGVKVDWKNTLCNSEIELRRNGLLLATLPGTATTYTDTTVPPTGQFIYALAPTTGTAPEVAVEINLGPPDPRGALIYEPFDYPIDGLAGQSGYSETGLIGTWNSNNVITKMVRGSLGFSNLETFGNSVESADWGDHRFGGGRAISSASLAANGLLADGATLWFSAIVGYVPGGPKASTSNLYLALANSEFSGNNNSFWIKNEGAQLGRGVGLSFLGASGRVIASHFRDSSQGSGATGIVQGSWTGAGPTLPVGSHRLVVGKITWGAGATDTVEIFHPGLDLALPATPSSTLVVDVDQSAFDTITFSRSWRIVLDEIRMGPTYESVTPTPETPEMATTAGLLADQPDTHGLPMNYSDWATSRLSGTSLSGFSQDADFDGIANGIEAYFGTNPLLAESANLTLLGKQGDTFTFLHPEAAVMPRNLLARYRWSTDLRTFHDDGASDATGRVIQFKRFPNNPQAGWTKVEAKVLSGTVPNSLFIDIAAETLQSE